MPIRARSKSRVRVKLTVEQALAKKEAKRERRRLARRDKRRAAAAERTAEPEVIRDEKKMRVKFGKRNKSLSTNGKEWLIQALHPMGVPLPNANSRIPDDECDFSVLANVKDRLTIPEPGTVNKGPAVGPPAYTEKKTWNCWIVSGPGVFDHAFVITSYNDMDAANENFVLSEMEKNDTPLFPDKKICFEAATPENKYYTITRIEAYQVPVNGWRRIRYCSSAMTVNLVCTALTNQGMVYGCQQKPSYMSKVMKVNATQANAGITELGNFWAWMVPPLNPDAQDQEDPKFMSHLAKEGCYVIHTIYPKGEFASTYGRQKTVAVMDGHAEDSFASEEFEGVVESMTGTRSSSTVMFSGIDVAASLDMKFKMGLEIVVAGVDSPMYPFATMAPDDDNQALELYDEFVKELPDMYPASYNDKNKLFGLISQIGQAVIGKIPLVSGLLEGVVQPLMNAAGNVVTSTVKSRGRARRG